MLISILQDRKQTEENLDDLPRLFQVILSLNCKLQLVFFSTHTFLSLLNSQIYLTVRPICLTGSIHSRPN